MDTFLFICSFIALVVALIGSIVPALPGVPIAYLSLWLGRWSGYATVSCGSWPEYRSSSSWPTIFCRR
jgi:hypothetical protein